LQITEVLKLASYRLFSFINKGDKVINDLNVKVNTGGTRPNEIKEYGIID